MKNFLDHNFLLTNEISQKIYDDYACDMPIIDYHCHINPQEIYENRNFENITQIWLGGDHYKWRLLRANGVAEKYITGDASDYDKFLKWAETLELAIGNPLYHWSHMELKNYFGYNGCLNAKTADTVWELCNSKLQSGELSARSIITKSKVALICTTDDPIDSLEWHEKLANDQAFNVQVLPTWRPDRAMNIDKEDFTSYLQALASLTKITISSFDSLMDALQVRMDLFSQRGCRLSDHGLDYVPYAPASQQVVEAIFQKGLAKEVLSTTEILQYQYAFMLAMAAKYHNQNWSMQLHYGCKRNNNERMYNTIGADTGYDCIGNPAPVSQMADFFNALTLTDTLPRTIVYSLNPNDNASICTIIGCFQEQSTTGKLQHGSAWWFNDHKDGMLNQMKTLASNGLLGNFIGMLTDSRSLLSYTRHDYFRRIMCNLIGEWVYNGEYPNDPDTLKKIICGISHNNIIKYCNFDLELL